MGKLLSILFIIPSFLFLPEAVAPVAGNRTHSDAPGISRHRSESLPGHRHGAEIAEEERSEEREEEVREIPDSHQAPINLTSKYAGISPRRGLSIEISFTYRSVMASPFCRLRAPPVCS